jgi:hypothetical protein
VSGWVGGWVGTQGVGAWGGWVGTVRARVCSGVLGRARAPERARGQRVLIKVGGQHKPDSREGRSAHGRVARQAEGEDVVLEQVEDGRERPARGVAVHEQEHGLAVLALPRLSTHHGALVVQHRLDE